jgi:hypothetical protein
MLNNAEGTSRSSGDLHWAAGSGQMHPHSARQNMPKPAAAAGQRKPPAGPPDGIMIAAAKCLGAAHGFRAVVRPCRSRRRSAGASAGDVPRGPGRALRAVSKPSPEASNNDAITDLSDTPIAEALRQERRGRAIGEQDGTARADLTGRHSRLRDRYPGTECHHRPPAPPGMRVHDGNHPGPTVARHVKPPAALSAESPMCP